VATLKDRLKARLIEPPREDLIRPVLEALLFVADQPVEITTLARSIAAAGRKSALERFDEQVVVPRILALYHEVVSRTRAGG